MDLNKNTTYKQHMHFKICKKLDYVLKSIIANNEENGVVIIKRNLIDVLNSFIKDKTIDLYLDNDNNPRNIDDTKDVVINKIKENEYSFKYTWYKNSFKLTNFYQNSEFFQRRKIKKVTHKEEAETIISTINNIIKLYKFKLNEIKLAYEPTNIANLCIKNDNSLSEQDYYKITEYIEKLEETLYVGNHNSILQK